KHLTREKEHIAKNHIAEINPRALPIPQTMYNQRAFMTINKSEPAYHKKHISQINPRVLPNPQTRYNQHTFTTRNKSELAYQKIMYSNK
ncbi:19141_t:CDS:1, partial [Funneliformis geosporum]